MRTYRLITGNGGLSAHLVKSPVRGTGWEIHPKYDEEFPDNQGHLLTPEGQTLLRGPLLSDFMAAVKAQIRLDMVGRGSDEPPPPMKPAEEAPPAKTEREEIRYIPILGIGHFPGGNQREEFPKLDELAESIRNLGIIQPLTVNEIDSRYTLIAGERRLRAAGLAGMATVPCRVMHLTEAEALEAMLVENIQREDLNPIEEAKAYKRLMALPNSSQVKIAKRVGKSQQHVNEYLQLIDLPADLQHQVKSKVTSVKTALEFLRRTRHVPDTARELVAKAIVEQKPSTRDVGEVIERVLDPGAAARAVPPPKPPSAPPASIGPSAPNTPPPDLRSLCQEVVGTLDRLLLDQVISERAGNDLLELIRKIEEALKATRGGKRSA